MQDALSHTEFELMELLDVGKEEVTSAMAHVSEVVCPPCQTVHILHSFFPLLLFFPICSEIIECFGDTVIGVTTAGAASTQREFGRSSSHSFEGFG